MSVLGVAGRFRTFLAPIKVGEFSREELLILCRERCVEIHPWAQFLFNRKNLVISSQKKNMATTVVPARSLGFTGDFVGRPEIYDKAFFRGLSLCSLELSLLSAIGILAQFGPAADKSYKIPKLLCAIDPVYDIRGAMNLISINFNAEEPENTLIVRAENAASDYHADQYWLFAQR